ncbi:MAG: hypothetical protein LLF94_05465, partial [Chlamydiales bacterium]|nr:hypothetical protein [Chlamydiales bacterium]
RLDPYGLLEEDRSRDYSFFDFLGDILSSGCESAVNGLNRLAEIAVHNMPHFGEINNTVVDSLREMRGAPPIDRRGACFVKVSDGKVTSTNCIAGVYKNGMCCSYEEAVANAKAFEEEFEGDHPDIYLGYSPSSGFVMDLIRAAYNIFGGQTSNISPITEGMSTLTNDALARGGGAYVLSVPHSLGGLTAHHAHNRLTAQQRGAIVVESVASTKMFHVSQGYKDAQNHVGWTDLVPLVSDTLGFAYRCAMQQGQVNMTGKVFQVPLSQHGFASVEYRQVLNKIASRHK